MKIPLFIALGSHGIRKIWHDKKMRGRDVTEDRAKILVETTHNSVGLEGEVTRHYRLGTGRE